MKIDQENKTHQLFITNNHNFRLTAYKHGNFDLPNAAHCCYSFNPNTSRHRIKNISFLHFNKR